MTLARVKIIQGIADLAFPLIGYFFWNWDFYFILLFFYLDLKIFCLFTFVKSYKIDTYKGLNYRFPWVKLLQTIALLIGSFLLVIPAMHQLDPSFHWVKNTWNFLAYQDMGIAQGLFLIPLLVYGGYSQYKLYFLQQEKYKSTANSVLWKMHFQTLFLGVAAAGLFVGFASWFSIPTTAYVLTLILGVSIYRFLFSR